MEDLQSLALLLVGALIFLAIRSLGSSISRRVQSRRAHLTQARKHFVKAASFLARARTGKLTVGEAKSLAGNAINEADLALELDPNDAAVLIVKCLALEQLGKPVAALKVLDLALSAKLQGSLSSEERADTLTKRAQLLLGQGKGKRDRFVAEALDNLLESVSLCPKNPRAQLMLGACYEKIGSIEQAENAFNQALLLDPASPDAKLALERLHGVLAKPASGISNFV